MDQKPNISLICLDSLRYDVAERTTLPNLASYLQKAGGWRKCYSHGTYTLPSHVAIFHAGFLPDDRAGHEPVYNRLVQGWARCQSELHGPQNVLYQLPPAPSVMEGFMAEGYNVIGVGGVGWFDLRAPTAHLWDRYFHYLAWSPEFHETNPSAFEEQIKVAQAILSKDLGKHPLLYYHNIPSTHTPYCGLGKTLEGQGKALQYVDAHLPELFALMPRPCHVFIFADHGDCFGESGLVGHSFYHPKVMEVPMVHFWLEGDQP